MAQVQTVSATMASDDLPESTRVFVSGLPPSFTSTDLRKHFAAKQTVTDAHVLSDRRIGFVGFRDHDAAEKAVKYFNRSFIRMSKIAVSLARPVDVKRDASGQAAPVSQKKEKFPKKRTDEPNRKRKRDTADDGETQRAVPTRIDCDAQQNVQSAKSSPEASLEEQGDVNASDDPNEAAPGPVSDGDWLRGKTSRVLDLRDPDAEWGTPTAIEKPLTPESLQDADISEETTDLAEHEDTKPDTDPIVDVPNARLFVRNLAFSASQQELETLFAAHGKIEEVCAAKFSPIILHDDLLIGTTYASANGDTWEPVILVDASHF
jgi:multiple RNA-binding domain-containing protein 1